MRKKEALDIKAKLEVPFAQFHEDIYNVTLQGEVSELSDALGEIEMRKTRPQILGPKSIGKRRGTKAHQSFLSQLEKKTPRPSY